MSKVTVEVVADTRPFLRSIAKLRRIAAQLNNVNYQHSNKLLKNILANHKLNEKITKEVQKQNKEYAKTGKLISNTVSGLGKLAAIGASITGLKTLASVGYKTGEGIYNTAAVYGGNPNDVVQARGLIARGGGRAEEGEQLYSKFMQDALLFENFQQGPFKRAAGEFGLDPRILRTGNVEQIISNIRELDKKRNYDPLRRQALLQEMGLGNNAAVMNLLNMSDEEYARNVAEVNEKLEESRIEWEKQLKLQQEWNKAMDDFKQQLMQLVQYLTPVLEEFNKLPTPLKNLTLALGTIGAGALFKGGLNLVGSLLGLGGGKVLAGFGGIKVLAILTAIHDSLKMLNGKKEEAWSFKIGEAIFDYFHDPAKWKEEARKNEVYRRIDDYQKQKNITVTIEAGDSIGREVGNALYNELQMSPVSADVNLR